MNPAVGYLTHLADQEGVTPIHNHEPSFWLRARLVDLHSRWNTGRMLTCRHVLTQPGGVFITALWLPEVMVCTSCAVDALRLPAAADLTCDRCSAPDPKTRAVAVDEQGVIVTFGLCPDCYRREMPA
ncbi:hypothetical protein [Phycicoccus duodecadis]|uniref:Uncharacterized protein n=1 Tax=Phycicoccus duodecadis TaxID=173053 RepID=A0A2N3YEX9_9MICO|nr:hypothetical protein [Phycicoccus duodecadis]PKW25412.1 hypothetical protein ATL31_0200 [Phycicoccus duodecadis]